MEILKTEKKEYCKGTQYQSNVLVVTINNARDYQNQFTNAINLVYKKNKNLKLDYFFAKNIKENVYELSFKIK